MKKKNNSTNTEQQLQDQNVEIEIPVKEAPVDENLPVEEEHKELEKIEEEYEADENGKKKVKTKPIKIPKIFSKKYTMQKLKMKVLRRIYIPADRRFVQSYYEVCGKTKKGVDIYAIPKDLEVTKKEQAKLLLIAKELKRQKGRVRWIPLVAVAAFIAVVCILFTTFKNKIIKNVITDACESVFKARCDIAYVDFRLFDASFKMGGLQIANKKEPMKNLFQIDRIAFDFDLTQLLRKRFVTDEISIEGVQTNTDRTYSGDISAKLAAKIAKKEAKKAKKAQATGLMKIINDRSDAAVASVENSVNNLIEYYNPKSVLEKSLKEMTTIETGKSIEEQVIALGKKWKVKPQELGLKVEEVKKAAEEVSKIKLEAVKSDPKKATEAITTVNRAYAKSKKLKEEAESIIKEVQTDFAAVQTMITDLDAAITHDKGLVASAINRYTSINLSTGTSFITGTVNNAIYSLLGKSYPYVMDAVNYLVEWKNTNKEKGKKSEKEIMRSMLGARSSGRDVYYRRNPPKVWIKKIKGSGSFGTDFEFNARNISSNMDQAGLPASADLTLDFSGIKHFGKLVVDTRSNSVEPLIYANYDCDGLPLEVSAAKMGAEGVGGVPSFTSKSKFDAELSIYEDDGFNLKGFGQFTNLMITAEAFEPEYVYDIYSNVLRRIDGMDVSANVGYRKSKGLDLKLDTDVDERFIASLLEELKIQLEIIKKEAERILFEKINEVTKGAFGEINSFEDLTAKIKDLGETAKNLEKQLEIKKKEFELYLNNKVEETKIEIEQAVNDKIEETKTEVTQAINDKIEEAKEDAREKTAEYIKGLLQKK